MVATAEGASLTEAHRQAQAAIVRDAQRAVAIAYHAVLDPRNLAASFPDYLRVVVPVVQAFRDKSATASLGYYRLLRSLEKVPGAEPTLSAAPPVEKARLATSLLVTGPVNVRTKVSRGIPTSDAFADSLDSTLGAVGRHVLNGSRDTLRGAVFADDHASGWARVSGGRTCGFCAMLVGRGPVYKSEDSGGFESHDHCHCAVVPVFDGSSGWTSQARAYSDLWAESTQGESGSGARAAFYRAHESSLSSPPAGH